MSTVNPIHLNSQAVQFVYEIPAEHRESELSLSIEIILSQEGWVYRANSQVFLDAKDLLPAGKPLPNKLELGTGESLSDQSLLIRTKVSRIKTQSGASNEVPIVKYTIRIETGTEVLSSFEKDSGKENPSVFNTTLLFRQL